MAIPIPISTAGSSVGDPAAWGGTFHPAPGLAGSYPEAVVRQGVGLPKSLRYRARNLRVAGLERLIIGFGFRKSCFCRQNVESNACQSYRVAGLLCKRGTDLFERLAREAPSSQTPERLCSWSLSQKSLGADELRLQGRHGVGCGFRRDQASPEVCPNRGVPVPPTRHALGACLCHASVVHQSRTIQRGEGILARAPGMAGARQSLLELAPRTLARGESAGRPRQRARTTNLARQLPRRVPIQRTADTKSGPHDGICG
jgi:hypothetical protein